MTIFNMNPAKPTEGWNQIMSLPRRLSLAADEVLRIEPAGDTDSLRRDHVHVESRTLPANRTVAIGPVRGDAMEISAEIDPKAAAMVEMDVLCSPDGEERTRILFFKERGYADRTRGKQGAFASVVSIDSSLSSVAGDVLSRPPETAQFQLEEGEHLRLRVFLDRSILEVFVNDKICLGIRVYPERKDSLGVSLRAQGQEAQLLSLDAWRMETIY